MAKNASVGGKITVNFLYIPSLVECHILTGYISSGDLLSDVYDVFRMVHEEMLLLLL